MWVGKTAEIVTFQSKNVDPTMRIHLAVPPSRIATLPGFPGR